MITEIQVTRRRRWHPLSSPPDATLHAKMRQHWASHLHATKVIYNLEHTDSNGKFTVHLSYKIDVKVEVSLMWWVLVKSGGVEGQFQGCPVWSQKKNFLENWGGKLNINRMALQFLVYFSDDRSFLNEAKLAWYIRKKEELSQYI